MQYCTKPTKIFEKIYTTLKKELTMEKKKIFEGKISIINFVIVGIS